MALKILTFNWHEGYIHLLAKTGHQFDVTEVTKGGYYGWMNEFRPVPPNCRLISEAEAEAHLKAGRYDRVICHNIDDLTVVHQYPIPKILIFHNKLSQSTVGVTEDVRNQFRKKLDHFIQLLDDLTLVFISPMKRHDWGLKGEIILPGIDPAEYGGYEGNIEKALSIGNDITDYTINYYNDKLSGVPFTILGDNPNIALSHLPSSWKEYKSFLRSYRAYMNIMEKDDDGYNLAMLEAMSTGMPVVARANPTSPIIDGVHGFLSESSEYLKENLQELLKNRPLAIRLGRQGRDMVHEKFSLEKFISRWNEVIGEEPQAKLKASRDFKTIYERNVYMLESANPGLAASLTAASRTGKVEIVYGKNGRPSMRVNHVMLHSLYDQEKEAQSWVQHYAEDIDRASSLVVFGFGLGYHLVELCRQTEKKITVVEPDLNVLRAAMKTVDLSSLLAKIDIVTDGRVDIEDGKTTILKHQVSVKLNQKYYAICLEQFQQRKRMTGGMKILVVGPIYGGSLPVAKYCSASLKKLGHTVELLDNSRFADALHYAKDITGDKDRYETMTAYLSEFLSETLLARCEVFKPDLVFALAQAPLTERCLTVLREHKVPTAFWFVEDFRFMDYWKKTARHYDYFFTIQKGEFNQELQEAGVHNYHYLPMAAFPDEHKPVDLSDEEIQCYGSDVSFAGAGYYNRKDFLKGLLDFDLKIWGTDWDLTSALGNAVQRRGARVSTEEMVNIFNAARININLHSSTYHKGINPFGDFLNPRTFEIMSCGGFQLVDRRSCLDGMFDEGKEIVVFDSLDDLREKVRYYLDRPEERQDMAARGRERILQHHTYEHRMREMLEYVLVNGYQPPQWNDEGEDVQSLLQSAKGDRELEEFFSRYESKEKVRLSDITEEIRKGEGDLSRQEKIVLMMHELST